MLLREITEFCCKGTEDCARYSIGGEGNFEIARDAAFYRQSHLSVSVRSSPLVSVTIRYYPLIYAFLFCTVYSVCVA